MRSLVYVLVCGALGLVGVMLAKVRAALGSLDQVKRVVKVLGMVNSPEGFGDQPRVVNGFPI